MHSNRISALAGLMILFFALPLTLHAQDVSIRGIVKEAGNKQEAIIGASVSLNRTSDSALIKTGTSGNDGRFELTAVPPGNYRLTVFLIGYKARVLPELVVAGKAIDLEEIRLESGLSELKQVEVTSRKALITQQSDKVVVNVEAAVSNTGSNALEVLERAPGVAVDKDGGISLRGKAGVTVMIDGKLSYVSGADLTKLLSSMPASQLSQVEIIANPSAKFDATGNAGIINIKTKKNTAYGFNGTVTTGYGQGNYWRTDNSLNLNYRESDFNAFLNYGFNVRNGFNQLTVHRQFFDGNDGKLTSLYDQPSLQTYRRTTNNLKLGLDYFVSSKTTIGFVATGQLMPQTYRNVSESYFEQVNGSLDSTVFTHSRNEDRFKNGTVNLNLEHRFDSLKTLTADLDYLRYATRSDQLFNNLTNSADGITTARDALKGYLPVDIRIYAGKTDYVQTFHNGLKLETGVKVSQVYTDNSAQYQHQDWDEPFKPDYGISNYFKYQENINAVYVNLSKSLKKWNLQAGLRFENTNYKGHQLGNPERPDSVFTRDYNNLFPTASIGYKINPDNEVTATYNRRIDRPAYQSLNPFVDFINKYTYEVGNPLLRPQYTNNAELSYLYKNAFSVAASFSETSNYFTQIFRSENMVTIFSQGNLSKLTTWGLAVNYQWGISKWWSANMNGNLTYKKVDGFANGAELRTSRALAIIGLNNQFSIAKGLAAELSGTYNSKDVEGQFSVRHYGQVSLGFSKQVLKNKGTLKLNVRDVFYTQVIYGSILYNDVKENYVQKADLRVVNLAFTYRFGKLSTAPARKKESSTEQEQNRVRN